MKRFLRYNTRHRLYFPGNGALPQLNPIMSRSHNEVTGKRTWGMSEPLWMFRTRQRLFCFGGRHRCGERGQYSAVHKVPGQDQDLPDTWDIGPDGNRTCSFCGSIHAEDLMAIARKTLTDERYGIEGTTKSYKVYVRQPGVRNASEGAIKFYKHHAPAKPSESDQQLFATAVRLTGERTRARFTAA